MDGALATGKTTAQHDDAISNLILINIIVIDNDDIITIDAGDGRNEWRGTYSQD